MPFLPDHKTEAMLKSSTWSVRRILVYLTTFLVLSWLAYLFFIPAMMDFRNDDISTLNESPQDTESQTNNHIIKLLNLPPKYLPQIGKHRNPGRLVVVGDVHGMKGPLLRLLEKVQFDEKHDHLILAGDMISKGPDSKGVVDLVMRLGATSVRGNHEDRIIKVYEGMKGRGVVVEEEGVEEEDDVEVRDGDHKDRKLVKQLGKKRIKWLEKCPVILRVGHLGYMGEVVVVHAGLAPGVKLEKQDPAMVMNMRTIKHGIPSDERDGQAWQKAWNHHQKSLPEKHRSTVIYGHDSKRGLQVKKYSVGIDTGCLKGGQLTAVVIEGGHDDHKYRLVHVNCKDERGQ